MTSPMMCVALLFLSHNVPLSSIRSQQGQGDQCIEVDSLGFDQMMMSNSFDAPASPDPQFLSALKAGLASLKGVAEQLMQSSAKVDPTVSKEDGAGFIKRWLKNIQADIKSSKALAEQVIELQNIGFNDERWENAHVQIQEALTADVAFRNLQEFLNNSTAKKQAAEKRLQEAKQGFPSLMKKIFDEGEQLTLEEVDLILKDDPLEGLAEEVRKTSEAHQALSKSIMQSMITIKGSLQQSIIKAGKQDLFGRGEPELVEAAKNQKMYVQLEMETAALNLKLSQLYFDVKLMFDNCLMYIVNLGLHEEFPIDKDGKIIAGGQDAEVWTDIQKYLEDFDPEIVRGFGQ